MGQRSLAEFARAIGKSYPTVCKMRDNGNFRYFQVGGRYYVSDEEIARFLSEGNLPPEIVDLRAYKESHTKE